MNDIEPNPGPRTTLQRAARTRRRIKKRLEKGNPKRKRKEEQVANVELKVATWNVRRANIYNGRFGEIVKECIERGWDIVCAGAQIQFFLGGVRSRDRVFIRGRDHTNFHLYRSPTFKVLTMPLAAV